MAKYKPEKISYDKQEHLLDLLCETLAELGTKKLIKDFIKDLMNRQERLMLVRRLLIAEMLEKGMTYDEIINELHCGAPTISKVQRWLNFGREGYKKAIEVKKISSRKK